MHLLSPQISGFTLNRWWCRCKVWNSSAFEAAIPSCVWWSMWWSVQMAVGSMHSSFLVKYNSNWSNFSCSMCDHKKLLQYRSSAFFANHHLYAPLFTLPTPSNTGGDGWFEDELFQSSQGHRQWVSENMDYGLDHGLQKLKGTLTQLQADQLHWLLTLLLSRSSDK